MDHSETHLSKDWEKLLALQEEIPEQQYPPVSLIIPTFNSAQSLGITIESLLSQDYPDFEIIVIDANSTDRTLEILKSYRDERLRLHSVTGYNRYEMMNKGISIAKGSYLNFLFPGDYYIQHRTLRTIMRLAVQNNEPALMYCGCLLREAQRDVKILFRPLSLQLLKKGQQPTSLQSCWFQSYVFSTIGKFNTGFKLRGGYELLCRFVLEERLTHLACKQILTDYDLRGVTRRMVIDHFIETFRIILKYFGLSTSLIWLARQNDIARYFRLWMRSVKVALLGSSSP